MAELKRNFSQAKMNKDMDERVLPAGQYRDANNIQISTSDGSDVGALQTVLGNTNVTENTVYSFVDSTISKVVGVQKLPEEDKIYFFVYSGADVDVVPVGTPQKDLIVEYNTAKKTTDFIFVDIHTVKHSVTTANSGSKKFYIKGGDASWAHGIRVGMTLSGTFNDGSGGTATISNTWNVKVTKIRYFASKWEIHHDYANNVDSQVGDTFIVTAPRVLKFNPHNNITNIDITGGMMFWTDGQNEPKKIHIERSKRGTGGTKPLNGTYAPTFFHNTMPIIGQDAVFSDALNTNLFHTRLTKRASGTSTQLVLAMNRARTLGVDMTEDHITVIKKSPTNGLSLKMFTSKADRTNTDSTISLYGTENPVFATTTSMKFYSGGGEILEAGETKNLNFQTDIDLRVGDILLLTNDPSVSASSFAADQAVVRVIITVIPNSPGAGGPPNTISASGFECIINSIDGSIGNLNENWSARVEQEKPMFEFKFPRFSYRWKYEDGEYSTFAPWSEVAFVPGDFDYLPKKGFNLGMSNRLRYLKLCNYFPEWGALPEDVIEVDLLYKEAGKKTVYTVKTLKPQDGDPIWPDMTNNAYARGEFQIDSELIHAVVPSNQLLRPWDNVPRVAKTQVMTGNRLVYGNYKQNYNIDDSLVLNCGKTSRIIPDSPVEDEEIPQRSVKSLRSYQIGVVWSDKYGRETPVMVPKSGGSVTIDKKDCVKQNWLYGKIKETAERPPWAEFVSYYVKETSNEYYNLAMDRFYNAEDGNVWISFPSAERNKIQQDTYLYLKKAHDGNLPVTEKARYRVIAVEDDAPLFIKAKKNNFGFETVEFITSGLPEEGRKYIIVKGTDFDNSFENTHDPVRLDNLEARIGGVSGGDILVSKVYTIVNISKSGSNYKITFDERLGDECGPISTLDPTAQMKLEIVQNKFENKPEFDGRFFVKILKDLTLEKELLSTMTTTTEYGVTETLNLSFGADHEGMIESKWDTWKNNHNGAYNTTRSMWFIDDIDSNTDQNIETDRINHGGMWNWPQDTSSGIGNAGGNGFLDLAYTGFKLGELNDRTSFTIPAAYFKTPGQLFRFKADPAQVVFKVEGYRSRLYENKHFGSHSSIPRCGGGGYDFAYYNSGDQHESTDPSKTMIGPTNDPHWNYHTSDNFWDNNRTGIRIKVDKMFGSGPDHLMTSSMARMSIKDASGDLVEIQDGERYDGAVVGGQVNTTTAVNANVNGNGNSGGTSNTWNVGDFHNWYPITSDTGVYLNTANQLKKAHDHWHRAVGGGRNYTPIKHNKFNYASAGGGQRMGALMEGKPWGGQGSEAGSATIEIEFLEPILVTSGDGQDTFSSTNPAIWETEPKEDIGLDIYYEASAKIPLNPDHKQNELLIPIGSKVYKSNYTSYLGKVNAVNSVSNKDYLTKITLDTNLVNTLAHDSYLKVERPDKMVLVLFINNSGGAASGQKDIVFTTAENAIDVTTGSQFGSERAPWHNPILLPWSNCWAFGNGVESDRVRDDYNAPQLDNGVKASTTLATPYEEEDRTSGMIFSGIFNSTSGVNNLNQFIQAEAITKDINPSYGTIQRMHARNTDTLVFCEDKVLNILTNKDALFNADGNSNVTASNRVLGATTPIPGDYGISTNPESLAIAPNAMYWVDQMRGKVLKLEGGSSIKILSDVGMKDYFNDTLLGASDILGTWDEKKKDFNISIGKKVHSSQVFSTKTTLGYSEVVQGWTCFKPIDAEGGTSLNNEYYTFKRGQIWQHHVTEDFSATAVPPNNFYGTQYYPDVTLIFNEQHSSVKSFNLINYEGTQSRITAHLTDPDYYNLTAKAGWYVDSMVTDLQEIGQLEFKSKEGKWFSAIQGVATDLANLDEREFSVQGLGVASTNTTGTPVTQTKLTVQPGHNSVGGTSWDSAGDNDADWNFTGNLTQTISSGTAYPAGFKDAELHNVTHNFNSQLIYSGLDLSAADYSVPGSLTVTSTGTGSAAVYTYTARAGWNADTTFSAGNTVSDGITKVEFSNTGIAGDSGNRVRARIYYHGFTATASAKTMFVDIDHIGTTSTAGNVYRNACVKVHYNQTINANSRSVTVASTNLQNSNQFAADGTTPIVGYQVANITETAINGFDPNGHAANSTEHEAGNGVLEGQTTKMAEYTITAGNAEYLVAQGNGKGVIPQYHTHSSASPWQSYFTYNVTNTFHTSTNNTNKIKASKVEIFYTPPVGVLGLDPDPVSGEGDWCTFMHCVQLTWLAREIVASTSNTSVLTGMGFSNPATSGATSFLSLNSTSAGNVGVVIARGSNYYTLTTTTNGGYTGVWGEGDGQSIVVNTVSIGTGLNEVIPIVHTTSNNLTTISAYNTVTSGGDATHLSLSSECPRVNARISGTQQNTISNRILFAALTNTTRVPTSVNGFTGTPGSTEINERDQNVLTRNISVVYLAGSGKTIAIDRQPTDSDISGGSQSAELTTGSAGGTTLTISNQDAVGLAAGMIVNYPSGNKVFTSTSSIAHASRIGVSSADYANVIVNEGVTGGNIPANTTVASKQVTNGIYIIVLSNPETTSSTAGVNYTFAGPLIVGTTISSIGASGANNKNLTISAALLGPIAQYQTITFGGSNNYASSSDLTAVMLETSTSSNGVITTVQNKKCFVSGTITVSNIATTASNFTINPNFLTVS